MNDTDSSIFDLTPNTPLQAIQAWLDYAKIRQVPEPKAVALATANRHGIASNRIVQILDVSEAGLVFATHFNSPKGEEINTTGWGSCVFWWPLLQRQIIVSGKISRLDDSESDLLWAGRPPEAHAMSTVSTQSATLHDEDALRQQALAVAATAPIKRPAKWGGYRLQLSTVEFWAFSPDRLYKRLKYSFSEGVWMSERLQP